MGWKRFRESLTEVICNTGRAGIVFVQNIRAGMIKETDEGYEYLAVGLLHKKVNSGIKLIKLQSIN